MPENMDKWASGNRKIAKSGHRVAAEMIPFPRRWHGSMISANLEAIWGMSVNADRGISNPKENRLKPTGRAGRMHVLEAVSKGNYMPKCQGAA